jgi:hypothetical protein
MKRLIAFDLDGTLAESKQPILPAMADLLTQLLSVTQVAVISGGDWPQFETQVVSRLPPAADLTRLWIMPTTGAKLYRFDGSWRVIYADLFTPEQSRRIRDALTKAVLAAGLGNEKTWGEQIEDRGSQITFSGLGQQAPLDAKKAWDPDFTKRKSLQKTLQEALPDLSINVGGSTSIDITQKGVDKAYAMRRLAQESGIPNTQMLFLGDAIYPGGNDDPVRAAGMDTVHVRDVQETMTAIIAIEACLKP